MDESLGRLVLPLSALMRWFRETGIRGVVVGGVAVSLRGKPRLTKDVDVVVLDVDAEALLKSAHAFDLVPRIDDAIEFARHTRVLLLRHSPTHIDIDVSLGALPFEEEIVERSELLDAGAVRVRVASAEDLVIMKAVAGRPRDIADIGTLIDATPDLDITRIRRWIREFSSVLEMPEIHENLEKLLAKGHRG
ncbi:MAG TPA: nucleotidyl transferase AbiEii/AbiGii toxin family protein [Thermoanaerobaculia bacterium]